MPCRFYKHNLLNCGKFSLSAAILFLSITIGCAVAPARFESEPLLSRADERMLWDRADEMHQSLLKQESLYVEGPLTAYVDGVVSVLRPNSSLPELKFKVLITKDPLMNAHAYPNGIIIITTGLLARLENEAQLAAVLAHEMAHCIGRDTLRAYRQCSGMGAVPWDNRHHDNPIDTRAGNGDLSEAVSECLKELVHQRESVADAGSLDMLVAAQYDPAEAIRVFYHQKEALSVDGGAESPAGGHHPIWYERMSALEEQLAGVDLGAGIRRLGKVAYNEQIRSVLLLNASLNLRHGRYQWASRDLKRYLDLRPQDARAHHLLGETFQQQGGKVRLESALACYHEAIRLDGSYAAPHKALGMLHYKQGHKQLARRYFQNALVLSPDDKDSAYIAGYLAECQN